MPHLDLCVVTICVCCAFMTEFVAAMCEQRAYDAIIRKGYEFRSRRQRGVWSRQRKRYDAWNYGFGNCNEFVLSVGYDFCIGGFFYLRLPRTSHISAFMFDHLHWLPLIAQIQLKVLPMTYCSHIGQAWAFSIIGPSHFNQLLPSTWSTFLNGEPSASFRSLKTAFFSLGLLHWKRFWLVCTARSTI